MMTKRITIIEVKDYVGQEVTIGAWVANKSGKGKIAFLQLRDGTAFFQGVAFKPNFIEKFGEEVGLEKFDTIKRLSQETSVFVTGIVKEDERSKFGYELDITDIEVIGESQDYPITPKEHGTDFLMDNRHLWLRSRKQVAVMQIRNAIIYATYEFFDKNGFMKFDSPILSGNAAEDSTELFETDYFGTPAYLSQSGQLYLEAGAMALGRVFDFGPVFRAEKSKTRRHLTEFWMMDAEYSYLTHDESLDLQEAYVKALLQGVLDRAPQALETLERDTELLKRYIAEPFKRITYDEAIDLLQEHENDEDADYEHLEHGDDFGSPHETWISNHFGVPTFVMNYPAAIKAFYMKPVPGNPERVLCADLLAPEGYGEIIGGSMREEDYDALVAKMDELGMDRTEYEFYLDLRKYGTVPHGGFGIGIERMVTFAAGTKHIASYQTLIDVKTPLGVFHFYLLQKTMKGNSMLKIDIIDGKEYEDGQGALIADLDHSIQQMLKTSYPESQMDDFITYKNLSQYCMDYLGQIIERANDKNEAIKQQVTGVMPESERPFNVEDRLTASYTFGQRVADSVARFGGSWTFIISFILMMAIWMLINVLHPFGLNFDPYPFILLNLALSTIAAIQAPLIMMSQNRAADYDRLQARNDFNVNMESEREIRLLHTKIDHMVQQDQTDLLEIQKLQTELLVSLSNQVAQLRQEMNQERMKEVEKM